MTANLPNVIHNTKFIFFEKLFTTAVQFIVGLYIIRYLGPKDLGVLSYVLAFVGLFLIFVNLGVDTILVREIAKEREDINSFYSTGFWLKAASSLLCMAAVNIISYSLGVDGVTRLFVFIVSFTLFFETYRYFTIFFEAKLLMRSVSLVSMLLILQSGVIKVVFILMGKPLSWFVGLVLWDYFLAFIGFMFLASRYGFPVISLDFDWGKAKYLISESWPLLLTGVFITIYHRIDQIMLFQMTSEKEVGLYSSAVRLTEVWYMVPIIVMTSLYPLFSRLKKESQEFIIMYKVAFRVMSYIAMPLALYVSFYSKAIVVNFLGKDYENSSPLLAVLIWSVFFAYWGVVNYRLLNATGFQKLDFILSFPGAVVNVVGNFLLIPTYGALGAAFATILAYGTGTVIGLFLRETRRYSTAMWSSAIAPALLLIVPILLIQHFVTHWLIAAGIFSTATAFIYLLYFKLTQADELIIIKEAIKGFGINL